MEAVHFNLHKSFKNNFWYVQCRQDLINKLLKKHLAKKKINKASTKVLDVGCGTGMNYKVLKNFGTVYNLDIDKIAIDVYKKKRIKNVFLGDAQNMKMFKANQFDVLCAIELIEHLPRDYLFIREAYRVLKKGGFLLLTAPAFKSLWSEDDKLAHHYRRYNIKQLENLLSKKFKINLLSYRYFFLFPFSVLIFMVTRFKRIFTGKSKSSLAFTPRFLNSLLKDVMRLENTLISKNIKLPFGVGIVALCEKR